MSKHTYYEELDAIRLLAAFAVIGIHATSVFTAGHPVAVTVGIILCFAVPVFIIMSGLSLHLSHRHKAETYWTFVSKRMSKVIVPYILFTLVYFMERYHWDIPYLLHQMNPVTALLQSLVLGNAASHLYFMIILIQLYLLYPLLKQLTLRCPVALFVVATLMTVIVLLDGYLRPMGIHLYPRFLEPGIILLFPRWLYYFVLGMMLATVLPRVLTVTARFAFITVGLWVLAAIGLLQLSDQYGFLQKETNLPIMLYATVALIMLFSVSAGLKYLPQKGKSLLRWMASQSFFVYFVHLLLFRHILSPLPGWLHYPLFHSDGSIFLYWFLAVGVSFGLAYIMSFIPGCQWLGIVPARRPFPLTRA